jgi:hypothetical protein
MSNSASVVDGSTNRFQATNVSLSAKLVAPNAADQAFRDWFGRSPINAQARQSMQQMTVV